MELFQRFLTEQTGSPVSGCSYGGLDRANRIVFEYHCFSLVITLSIIPILMFNSSLQRFYAPLARIVNIALAVQVLSDLVFFNYHPYAEDQGNCTEIILGRLYTALIMF